MSHICLCSAVRLSLCWSDAWLPPNFFFFWVETISLDQWKICPVTPQNQLICFVCNEAKQKRYLHTLFHSSGPPSTRGRVWSSSISTGDVSRTSSGLQNTFKLQPNQFKRKITVSEHQHHEVCCSLNELQQFHLCRVEEQKQALLSWLFDLFSHNSLET